MAQVVGFADGYFSLQGYNDQGELPSQNFKFAPSQSELGAVAEPALPISPEDARRRIEAQIVARQGGKRFREEALKRFDRRCAISGYEVVEVLEAAHIVPYLGEHTNTPDNALLLRADLHTLFDRELVTIDPATLQVQVHPSLLNTPYGEYHGQGVKLGAGVTSTTLRDRLLARMGLIGKQSGA
ncbi:MAG: HNH endonuclease [Brevundimonas sp.]|uniref:HNH endonuclease n=1 Tax=Brevundimonas sp. TaxID=1871086 RepID=UPI003001E361